MTTINSIANLLVNSGLSEAEAFEMAEHDFNTAPTYAELAQADAEYEEYCNCGWDDYDDIYDDYSPFEDDFDESVYLDDVLAGLDENTNVIIFLNSARIFYGGFGVAPHVMQECIGNHYAHNWVEALNLVHLNHALDAQYNDTMYKVLSVVEGQDNTVSVYLDATYESNHTVHELDYAGNLCSYRY